MQLECNDNGSASVITVKGDLLSEQAAAIVETIATRAGRPNIVIDFDACRFFASVGLRGPADGSAPAKSAADG